MQITVALASAKLHCRSENPSALRPVACMHTARHLATGGGGHTAKTDSKNNHFKNNTGDCHWHC